MSVAQVRSPHGASSSRAAPTTRSMIGRVSMRGRPLGVSPAAVRTLGTVGKSERACAPTRLRAGEGGARRVRRRGRAGCASSSGRMPSAGSRAADQASRTRGCALEAVRRRGGGRRRPTSGAGGRRATNGGRIRRRVGRGHGRPGRPSTGQSAPASGCRARCAAGAPKTAPRAASSRRAGWRRARRCGRPRRRRRAPAREVRPQRSVATPPIQ